MADGVKSPLVHEFSHLVRGEHLSSGRGYAEVSYIFRKTTSLIEDFQDRTTGTTNVIVSGVSAGTFTNIVYRERQQRRGASPVSRAWCSSPATGFATTGA